MAGASARYNAHFTHATIGRLTGLTDMIGIGAAVAVYLIQKLAHPDPDAPIPVRGAD